MPPRSLPRVDIRSEAPYWTVVRIYGRKEDDETSTVLLRVVSILLFDEKKVCYR